MTFPGRNVHSRNGIRPEPDDDRVLTPPDRPSCPAPPTTKGAPPMPPQRNDMRNDNQTTTPCPVCARPFTPIRRQQYCTPACRQSAWRARHHDNTPPPTIALPPRTPRRPATVYQCSDCDTRHLGRLRHPGFCGGWFILRVRGCGG